MCCQFCDERVNAVWADQIVLKLDFVLISKQQADYPSKMLGCKQSKHWCNRVMSYSPWNVCKAFSQLFSVKPNLYFRSLNTSVFVTLVVPLLLCCSQNLYGVQLHDWQVQKKDAKGIFLATERRNLCFHIWTVSRELLAGLQKNQVQGYYV